HRISAGGRLPDTAILESADRTGQTGERSLIAVRSALRIRAFGRTVEVDPLTPNGEAAAAFLAARHADALRPREPGARTFAFAADPGDGPERDRFRRRSPFDLLRTLAHGPVLLAAPNRWCHLLLGTFGYDAIEYFEPLPAGREDPLGQPTLEFWLPDQLLVIDHARQTTTVVTTAWGGDGAERRYHDASRSLEALVQLVQDGRAPTPAVPPPAPVRVEADVDQDDAAYAGVVARLKEHIAAGDVYQIVPSRTFALPCSDPLGAYAALRVRNPSPYLFFLAGRERTLFGASPETCLRVDGPSRTAAILPIAGTVPRGRTPDGRIDPDADIRNEVTLRLDPKELAEHLMLVDLARNDVARISVPGTRTVARLLTVERYSHVMHLVSEVTGTLAPGIDALEAYAATMNMGTLVGAPKVRAAELLREHEPSRRGCYGGAVGYLLHDGTLETAIVIRSAVVADGMARVRAGAGVVLDSDPVREADETSRKARAVLEAIAAAAGEPAHV
ncbi:MAG: anthranilate synthase component 1, partial [Gemmatimonadales bacterium]